LLTLLVVARQSINQLIMIYKYRDMKQINIEIFKVLKNSKISRLVCFI